MKRTWGLWAALAVGGGLRLWQAAAAFGTLDMDWPGWGHYQTGLNLLIRQFFSFDLFGGFALPGRGPLYPTFIALAEFPFSSPHPGWILLATALYSTVAIALAYRLGCRLVSPWAGTGAALCLALDPFSIRAVSSLNVHAFYSVILLAAASAAAAWAEKPGARSGAWAGLCFAASLLCRGAHLLFAPLLAAAWLAWQGGKKAAWRSWLWAGAAALALLAPVAARQSLQAGRFVFLDSGIGSYGLFTAALGEDAIAEESRAITAAERLRSGLSAAYENDVPGLEAELRALAYAQMRAHPGRYLRGVLRRLKNFWLPLSPALLLAVLALRRRPENRGFAVLFLFLISLSGYAAIGLSGEYRLAAHPLAAVVGACALGLLLERSDQPDSKAAFWAGPLAEGTLVACAAAALLFLAGELLRYGWPARPAALAAVLPARLERHLELSARAPAEVARLALSLHARGETGRANALLEDAREPGLIGLRAHLRGHAALISRAVALDPRGVCSAPRPFWVLERHEAPPEYFTACLSRFPDDPALLVDRGVAWHRRGDARRARADFARALTVRPGFEAAVRSLEAINK